MFTTSVDGVPVFFAQGPPPLSAGLVFGVGRRDETFVGGGITHLVEHLVMRAVGRTAIEVNASVDLTSTEFTASGPADHVVAFLHAVCGALGNLPVAELAVEADVLRAEGGTVAPPAVALLLGELYGSRGAGLAASREPGVRALGPEDVRGWVRRFFTRGNAALWLTGPVPEGLRLPLPEGPAPERAAQPRLAPATPAWGQIPVEERVTLGAEVPPHPALTATMGVLRTRVEDELRHRRGVAYSIELDRPAVDASTRVAVLTTDVRPGHEAFAAQLIWRELHRLADLGPEPAEIERERAEVTAFLDDPRADLEEACATAHATVTGIPVIAAAELRRNAAELSGDAVREVAGALLASAVLLVPADTDPRLPGLVRLPEWSADVVTGRVFPRKRLRGVPKEARLVVGDEGATLVLDEDRLITVRWREAVGLVRQGPDECLLVGPDGFSLPLSAEDWRNGAEALALALAAVPEELQVVDDDALDDGLLLLRAPAHRVREAVAHERYGARLVANGEWTAVLPEGGRTAESVADDLSAVLGRGTTGLVLRRSHVDVGYVLLRGAKEVDRHGWGASPGNPQLLARATGRPDAHTAHLLGVVGTTDEILQHVVLALGLPLEVPALMAGAEPTRAERVEGQGIAGAFRASVRGDFVGPEGSGGPVDRWMRLTHTRPGWYRAANACGALLAAAVLYALVTVPDLLDGGFGEIAVWVLAGSGLVNCLWETRPPRRPGPAGPTVEDRPVEEPRPTPTR
ncbi:insulinase family protein [Blastococcus xanthinilyticus]|uniref:Putative Zn-dependent peptidase n=1 Tax=Blastococcus xanthinilyticus TaxID=1564164 RepID=A0A5S5CQI8_9ACTN|nr:insulinase family protein [Blastococcus xanthinilyticus]TYP85953.1 putative Zn-dependent peptidase [Blastococcus xanthinilyticus]